jgi:putative PIN family toxin of toxin-antitoxin system
LIALRIVLDTNVLISGLFYSGPPRLIIEQILSGKHRFYTSMDLLAELDCVLKLKFQNSQAAAADTLEAIKRIARLTIPKYEINAIQDDPDDNRVLECALSAEADVIISGDKHLLKLKKFRDVLILNPQEFLKCS